MLNPNQFHIHISPSISQPPEITPLLRLLLLLLSLLLILLSLLLIDYPPPIEHGHAVLDGVDDVADDGEDDEEDDDNDGDDEVTFDHCGGGWRVLLWVSGVEEWVWRVGSRR